MEKSTRRRYLLTRSVVGFVVGVAIVVGTSFTDMSGGDRLALLGIFGGGALALAALSIYMIRRDRF